MEFNLCKRIWMRLTADLLFSRKVILMPKEKWRQNVRSHKDRVPLLLHWFKPRVWCFESLIHFYSDVSFMIVGERRESKRKGWLLLLLLLLKVKTNCKMSQQKEFSYTQFNTRIDSSTRIFEVILWLCFYWIQLWRFSPDCVDIHVLIVVLK